MAVLCLGGHPSVDADPTLKPITIDGDMSDWMEVLANPAQITADGDGFNCALPFGVAGRDRDCEVPAGTGRDMLVFGWTYDDTHLYLHMERWRSSSNLADFFIIMDLDGDERAENSDLVLWVTWYGSGNQTAAQLHYYSPADSIDGDPLEDPTGMADGYDMPGSVGAVHPNTPAPIVEPGVDTTTQRKCEFSISWENLGLPPGSPLNFHVASSETGDLSLADDNLGGPDGAMGVISFDSVDLETANEVSANGPGSVLLPHAISNTGNRQDRFTLRATSELGLHLTYFSDPDGDGDPSDGELMGWDSNGDGDLGDPGDFIDSGYDSDADTLLDVTLDESGGAGARFEFVVDVVLPAVPASDTDSIKLQVDGSSDNFDSTIDIVYVGYLTLRSPIAKSGIVGGHVPFEHTVANNTDEIAIGDFVATSSMGWQIAIYNDADGDGIPDDPGSPFAVDNEGDGVWDVVDPLHDANGNGLPDSGPLAPHSSIRFVTEVSIPGDAPLLAVDSTLLSVTDETTGHHASVTCESTVRPAVTIEPDLSLYGHPGSSIYYPFVVTSASPESDLFNISASSDIQGWPTALWTDPDGDGNIHDGTVFLDTDNIAIEGQGGAFNLIAELKVPETASYGDADDMTASCTSTGPSGASDVAIGSAVLHQLQSFRDPQFLWQARSFCTCETAFIRVFSLTPNHEPPGYDLRMWGDPAKTDLRNVESLATDSLGSAQSRYTIGPTDPLGTWVAELLDGPTWLDEIDLLHERAGFMEDVAVGADPALDGQPLTVSIRMANANLLTAYPETLLETRVYYNDGMDDWVLQDDGSFSTVPGTITHAATIAPLGREAARDHRFTVGNVHFPFHCVAYTVEATWKTAAYDPETGAVTCEAVIAGDSATTFIGDRDEDGDDAPDCSDICPGVYNPLQDLNNDPLACGNCVTTCEDGEICTTDTCAGGVCQNDLWGFPTPARDLRVSKGGLGLQLDWIPPLEPGPSTPTYDLLRSTDPADFVDEGKTVCVESDDLDTTATEATPAGQIHFYLVAVQDGCSGRNLGSAGGSPRVGRECSP
jgi:hypothetical protein